MLLALCMFVQMRSKNFLSFSCADLLKNFNAEEAKLQRIIVVGTSCSGKTTLSARIASTLNLRHVELDMLHWGPNWTVREDFEDEVENAVQQLSWVVDGNYRKVRDIIWCKADTLIWLNYSFAVVFYRALKRTFLRILHRKELYAGNRENLLTTLFSSDSILWWVITTHQKRKLEYSQLAANKQFNHLQIVCLNNQRETNVFLNNLKYKFSKSVK